MARTSLVVAALFGLAALVAALGQAFSEELLGSAGAVATAAARRLLGLVAEQAGHGAAMCVAACFCFAAASGAGPAEATGGLTRLARAWGWACLLLAPVLVALSAAQVDPRLVARMQTGAGSVLNDLRAILPQVRLGVFVAAGLSASAIALAQSGVERLVARMVCALALVAVAVIPVFSAEAGLVVLRAACLPLLLLVCLTLTEGTRPGAPQVLFGTLACIGGMILNDLTQAGRPDLRLGYAVMPLVAALSLLLRPAVEEPWLWLHAAAVTLILAYGAPGLSQFGDIREPAGFSEIGPALAESARLRLGMDLILAALALLAVGWFWRRRTRTRRGAPRRVATG